MSNARFLKAIGVDPGLSSEDGPVFEGPFIKFMSDGGKTDNLQGDQFEAWLKKKGYGYIRSEGRKFQLSKACAFRLTEIDGMDGETREWQLQEIQDADYSDVPKDNLTGRRRKIDNRTQTVTKSHTFYDVGYQGITLHSFLEEIEKELPGFTQQQLTVSVCDGQLEVSGSRLESAKERDERVQLEEERYAASIAEQVRLKKLNDADEKRLYRRLHKKWGPKTKA